MHPLPRGVVPIQVLLKPRVKIFNRLQVAEANHEPVVVRRERVDRNAIDHVSVPVALELAEVSKPMGYLHALLCPEAVLEDVLLVLLEGERVQTILDLYLGALCLFVNNKPCGNTRIYI